MGSSKERREDRFILEVFPLEDGGGGRENLRAFVGDDGPHRECLAPGRPSEPGAGWRHLARGRQFFESGRMAPSPRRASYFKMNGYPLDQLVGRVIGFFSWTIVGLDEGVTLFPSHRGVMATVGARAGILDSDGPAGDIEPWEEGPPSPRGCRTREGRRCRTEAV